MGKGARNRQNRTAAREDPKIREIRREVLREFNNNLVDASDRLYVNWASTILWVLHQQFGFGHDRLRRFYTEYTKEINSLKEYYKSGKNINDVSSAEVQYVAAELLKGIGVDVAAWAKE